MVPIMIVAPLTISMRVVPIMIMVYTIRVGRAGFRPI
jgi:hypothetical protein